MTLVNRIYGKHNYSGSSFPDVSRPFFYFAAHSWLLLLMAASQFLFTVFIRPFFFPPSFYNQVAPFSLFDSLCSLSQSIHPALLLRKHSLWVCSIYLKQQTKFNWMRRVALTWHVTNDSLRTEEHQAKQTPAGVRGVVDAGVVWSPPFFFCYPSSVSQPVSVLVSSMELVEKV